MLFNKEKVTEYEKMLAGDIYNQADISIVRRMVKGNWLCTKLNRTAMIRQAKRNRLIKKLFGYVGGEPYYVASPLYVQYGVNVSIGKNFVSNFNLVLLDGGKIEIGDNVMIAPNVTITTELHPMIADERKVFSSTRDLLSGRRGDYEYTRPVKVEDGVWICSNVTVCPGVTIGKNSVIGAGSVVTRDIPANVFACGIPCKVIREITDEDKIIKNEKLIYRDYK